LFLILKNCQSTTGRATARIDVSVVSNFKELSIHNRIDAQNWKCRVVSNFKELSIHNNSLLVVLSSVVVSNFKELSIHNCCNLFGTLIFRCF